MQGEAARALARDFKRNERGKIAVIAALTVLPIAAVTGFAIDFQLIATKKNKIQRSLDSAALAGCKALSTGEDQQQTTQTVLDYFDAVSTLATQNADPENSGEFIQPVTCETPNVSISDTTLVADSRCKQTMSMGMIAGVEEIEYTVASTCTFGIGKLDVAFVFDVSGSMAGSRMRDLKAAATDAIETLVSTDNPAVNAGDIRVAMVAYNDSLNAGEFFEDATGKTSNQEFRYYHYYYRRWFSLNYNSTCVYERIGDEAFSDAAPNHNISVEDTGFTNRGDYITAANFWDRNECRDAPPQPLTSDKDELVEYIDNLDPSGGTAGHLGIAWGWYMISPEWSDILPVEPIDYDEPDTTKAIVLMTDGDFNATFHRDLGSSRSQAEDLCDNIKDKDILIYSVAFQAPQSGEDILEYCATSQSTFFDPSNGQELADAYRSIATSISDLRIVE